MTRALEVLRLPVAEMGSLMRKKGFEIADFTVRRVPGTGPRACVRGRHRPAVFS